MDKLNVKKYLTVQEAARLLSISPQTLRKSIKAGKIKVLTINNSIRICRTEIDNIIK